LSTIDRGRPESSELPLVCICIPTYNAAATVGETLESVLAQTYPNLVVQVADNASTDDTLAIVESIASRRISVHRHDANAGAEGNFNRCIQLARGKYTAIFHADDIYEPNMVEKQVAFLEANPDVGAVFTEAVTIDAHGLPLGAIGRAPGGKGGVVRFGFRELLQTMLLHHNFLVCSSAMVRTEIYKSEIREWGSSLFRSASDVDTWLRLAEKAPIAVLGEQLMRYRISCAQFSDAIRNRTERTDFFLVMDHYLAKPGVRHFITKDDLRHYAWLERHERVARALNLFGSGRVAEADELLTGLFCWDSIRAAMTGRRGLVTLAGGTLLRVLIRIGASKKGAAIVKAMKRVSWR
jgi:glycosyltransferase involved in cell wall biosynthesis